MPASGTESVATPVVDFPSSSAVRDQRVLLKPSRPGYLLQPPEPTETTPRPGCAVIHLWVAGANL